MAIDVTAEVLIKRRRDEVAAFMFDPHNDAVWTTGVVEARPLQEGLLETGAKVERVSKFLGRRLEYLIEVTGHSAGEYVEMLTNEPFEMRVRYELEDAGDEETTARIRAAGGGTGFFRLAAPLLGTMVRRSIQNDLENLKAFLDAGGDEGDSPVLGSSRS
jgi:hypothetical protein